MSKKKISKRDAKREAILNAHVVGFLNNISGELGVNAPNAHAGAMLVNATRDAFRNYASAVNDLRRNLN